MSDLNDVVEEVILNGWLDQPLPAAFAERLEKESLSLETIAKRGRSREHYLWGLAGAMASSGRHFQSREQYYKLLMTFWGLRAPPRIPALSGKGILDEGSVQPTFSGRMQHKDFVAANRSTIPRPPGPCRMRRKRQAESLLTGVMAAAMMSSITLRCRATNSFCSLTSEVKTCHASSPPATSPKRMNEKGLCEDCKFGTASWLGWCKLLLGTGLEVTLDATSWAETGCFAIMPMKKLRCSFFLGEASISKFTTESKSLESAALVLTPSFESNL